MKKFLAAALMAVVSLGAFAQSNMYIGGSAGFWRNSSDNKTEFRILPEIGYNLSDQVAIGTVIGYDHNYDKGLSIDLVDFSPYVRYSFLKSGKVKVFIDGGVDLGFGRSKADGHSSDTAITYGIGLKPGFVYDISDDFSLVAHIGYVGFKGGNHASHAPNQGGVMLDGDDLSIGFSYKF